MGLGSRSKKPQEIPSDSLLIRTPYRVPEEGTAADAVLSSDLFAQHCNLIRACCQHSALQFMICIMHHPSLFRFDGVMRKVVSMPLPF